MTDESDDIASRVEGGVGFVTLNRPKAINSLNQGMVSRLRAVLTAWEQDDAISAVVLFGAGERGLCAGGDVVAIYHSARSDGVAARRQALESAVQADRFAGIHDGLLASYGEGPLTVSSSRPPLPPTRDTTRSPATCRPLSRTGSTSTGWTERRSCSTTFPRSGSNTFATRSRCSTPGSGAASEPRTTTS